MLYHASQTPGLRVLTCRISTHGEAYVYATRTPVTSLIFGAKHDDFDFKIDCDASGIPHIHECYPDAFDTVYHGKACSLYEVAETGFEGGHTSWDAELVSITDVPVASETCIPDLLTALLEAQKIGHLVIHRYSNAPAYRKMISTHIVDRLIRFDALAWAQTDARMQKHFKKLVDSLTILVGGTYL